ncbi:MAG: methyltransferase domain-containing protein [Chloroflexi bacterium]|nr:methyltransferase domain-containing protein [Chloroflexota bacterium]
MCAESSPMSAEQAVGLAARLDRWHTAQLPERKQIVAHLLLRPGQWVLDAGCGNGVFLSELARAIGPTGKVVGVDQSAPLLNLAQKKIADLPYSHLVELKEADLYHLPFPAATFDLVWIASTLHGQDQPLAVLQELKRVARPGGQVVALDTDYTRRIFLPLEPALEQRVQTALLRAIEVENPAHDIFLGRRLLGLFQETGFERCGQHIYTVARTAPLRPLEQAHIHDFINPQLEKAAPYLDQADRLELYELFSPQSPRYMLVRPEFHYLELLVIAFGISPFTPDAPA